MMEEGHVWGIRSLRSFSLEGKYLQLKYTLSISEKISICLIRGPVESLGNVTFLYCSRPQVRDGQDDVKHKIPEGTAYVDVVKLIVQSYFDIFFASRVISDVLWSTCFERHSSSADEVGT